MTVNLTKKKTNGMFYSPDFKPPLCTVQTGRSQPKELLDRRRLFPAFSLALALALALLGRTLLPSFSCPTLGLGFAVGFGLGLGLSVFRIAVVFLRSFL